MKRRFSPPFFLFPAEFYLKHWL